MSASEPATRPDPSAVRRPGALSHARRHSARVHVHTRRALVRSAPELRTLAKFTIVGGSGYLVNLVVFAIAEKAGAH